jgi:hypothetical protein
MDNRWELAELGFTADTLKPSDRVVVSGSPARTFAAWSAPPTGFCTGITGRREGTGACGIGSAASERPAGRVARISRTT